MGQYLLYSTSIHIFLFVLLFFFLSSPKKVYTKHYYIDFIGREKIETIQNNVNQNPISSAQKEKIDGKKLLNEKPKETQNFDKDDFFKDSTPLKPSLASENPQIFKYASTQAKEETSYSNGINTDSDFPYPWYITQIREALWESWIKRMPTSNTLRCTVKFKILRNGKITNVEIEKSSGNRLFDYAALSSVENVEKFPPLPDDFFENNLTVHVEFKNTVQ